MRFRVDAALLNNIQICSEHFGLRFLIGWLTRSTQWNMYLKKCCSVVYHIGFDVHLLHIPYFLPRKMLQVVRYTLYLARYFVDLIQFYLLVLRHRWFLQTFSEKKCAFWGGKCGICLNKAVTVHSARNYFFLYVIKYSLHWKIKVVDLN
jgi:hypothetical protein